MDCHIIAAYRRQTASRPHDIEAYQSDEWFQFAGGLPSAFCSLLGKIASMRDVVERDMIDAERQLA
jgi:hypothetical protein